MLNSSTANALLGFGAGSSGTITASHMLIFGILGASMLVAIYARFFPVIAIENDEKLSKRQFVAIDFARLLGAVCIINKHIHGDDPVAVLWLTFFFIVSGLGAATSRLNHADSIEILSSVAMRDVWPSPRVLCRRLATVYPTYLLALALMLIVMPYATMAPTPTPSMLPYVNVTAKPQLVILESLLVGIFRGDHRYPFSYPYNYPDWFVGALAICWLFENVLFYAVACGNRILGTMVLPVVFATSYMLTCFLAFHGYAFCGYWWQGLPPYVIGVALAFAIKKDHIPQIFSRVSASLAIGLMLLLAVSRLDVNISLFSESRDRATTFSAVASPVPLLLVIGLCESSDPITRLFASRPLPSLGNQLSMCMYLLQRPVIFFWDYAMPKAQLSGDSFGSYLGFFNFMCFLAVVSAIAHRLFQVPLQRIMLKLCEP